MIQQIIVDYLFNEENKKKLIIEAKVLDAVWDSVEEVLKNAILKSK